MSARSPRSRRFVIIALVFLLSISLGGMGGMLAGYLKSAPTLDEVYFNPELITFIYDIEGRTIARLYRENRIPVKLEEIPQELREGLVAVEDHRFYNHRGVDFVGVGRAIVEDIRQRRKAQGASTITMQLARNAFLTHERTWSRKLQEVLWAVQIERKYTKYEILETFLNEIYFGHGAHGVEAAAQLYFSKSVTDLDLAESAQLIAIIRGPAIYSPLSNPQAATDRRNLVLRRMAETGVISAAEAQAAMDQSLELTANRGRTLQAPYFVDYVLDELLRRHGEHQVYGGGLHIYTSLDLDLQAAAEKTIAENPDLARINRVDDNGLRQPQAALVALDPATGHIKAMVGGRDRDKGDRFNRAVQSRRQPGSSIKPFIYTAAIDQGLTPATVREDEPFEHQDPYTQEVWAPQNYDREFRGPVTLREALEHSLNVIAVRLLKEDVDVRTVIDYTRRMGINTLVEQGSRNDVNLAFALGGLTQGVRLLEMASAYGVLANQGIRVEPISILRVEGPNGEVLGEYRPRKEVVLQEETSYVVTDMLRGVIERGTGVSANIGRPAAGKTGTTDSYRDAWFVGYTPNLVSAVWIGEDTPRSMTYSEYGRIGSRLAATMWGGFMREAVAGTPIQNFPRPHGVAEGVLIDTKTGLLVRDDCAIPRGETRLEIFVTGTEPDEFSPRCWEPLAGGQRDGENSQDRSRPIW